MSFNTYGRLGGHPTSGQRGGPRGGSRGGGQRRGWRGGSRGAYGDLGGFTGGSYSGASVQPDREIRDGLTARHIKTFSKPEPVDEANIAIKDLTYIGSYNWINAKKPTIIIPGSPRIWRDRPLPYRVPPDAGFVFVDPNSHRMPSSPLYPLFHSVDIVAEESGESIVWPGVDFVTDRNGLRKLLRWINDADGSAKPFRIDMQLAGKRTVLFSRWEKRTQGWDLDGLTLIVRFEVDACLPSGSSVSQPAPSTDADSLADMLSGMNVGAASQPAFIDAGASTNELDVISAGQHVPQSSIIEMTTRSKNYVDQYEWKDSYPQLYLSQTTLYYLAAHTRGDFEMVTKRRLDSVEMKKIDEEAQEGFRPGSLGKVEPGLSGR
ncbi:predicted protein [Postia placenta Mad-698-R]|uniref:Uncharacterized protein n=1 Tax=Postia placenta MAD-698-R-SB12 TaxID=670580 RepID=A0A1X6MLR7_9APHY|nr:hypothetical protein POSPLADRAFT_1157269 [Postia placenta MAD-698-R-SB12]EED81960.1 predicted protein [Postia placenta Mad-698-R]OSX57112.1 hypothetical protein POSPLADRAFT_1157269 [Postia placenta MAD-698-R-SB12]